MTATSSGSTPMPAHWRSWCRVRNSRCAARPMPTSSATSSASAASCSPVSGNWSAAPTTAPPPSQTPDLFPTCFKKKGGSEPGSEPPFFRSFGECLLNGDLGPLAGLDRHRHFLLMAFSRHVPHDDIVAGGDRLLPAVAIAQPERLALALDVLLRRQHLDRISPGRRHRQHAGAERDLDVLVVAGLDAEGLFGDGEIERGDGDIIVRRQP